MLTFMRLFGDGKHGHAEQIQTFRGPACRTTFTSRRNTALYRLKTPSQQIAMVLCWLLEASAGSVRPLRTSHSIASCLPIPKRKSISSSIHLLIFTKELR